MNTTDAVIELAKQYKQMSEVLDDIKAKLYALKHPDENFMDNDQFLKMMNVSKRTAQMWRDKNMIDYFKVGSMIYYETAQVRAFLKRHEVKRG